MQQYIIIVAGGSGTRMGSEIPKQFLPVKSRPVLMHTIEAFYKYDPHIIITLVLPSSQFEYWNKLCDQHNFSTPLQLAAGGNNRYESVKNGLDTIKGEGLIGIHDGVRPLVSTATIKKCFDAAEKHGAVIPVRDVEESLRYTDANNNKMANRADFRIVQTPQVFQSKLLKDAYQLKLTNMFLDDATVVEQLGVAIHLVEGNRENIKITTPFDLKVAEAIL